MYIFLILFFTSLLAITFMIGRKVVLVRGGQIEETEHSHHVFIPDIEKIKQITGIHAKRYGYFALVTTLRVYIKSSNALKNQYKNAKTKIQKMRGKSIESQSDIILEEKEANKFLKMITDYKHRIREIKHKIKREEEK